VFLVAGEPFSVAPPLLRVFPTGLVPTFTKLSNFHYPFTIHLALPFFSLRTSMVVCAPLFLNHAFYTFPFHRDPLLNFFFMRETLFYTA